LQLSIPYALLAEGRAVERARCYNHDHANCMPMSMVLIQSLIVYMAVFIISFMQLFFYGFVVVYARALWGLRRMQMVVMGNVDVGA
jgi:hypothetical protein